MVSPIFYGAINMQTVISLSFPQPYEKTAFCSVYLLPFCLACKVEDTYSYAFMKNCTLFFASFIFSCLYPTSLKRMLCYSFLKILFARWAPKILAKWAHAETCFGHTTNKSVTGKIVFIPYSCGSIMHCNQCFESCFLF